MIFKTVNRIIQTGNGIISPISRPLIKKLILQNVSHFHQGVHNWFSKQGMELSKQETEFFKEEMELFHPLLDLWSKNLFYKMSLIFTKEFIIDFQNREWNYPNRKRNYLNRKWNYFAHFQTSDQKAYFTKCLSFSPRSYTYICDRFKKIRAKLYWKTFLMDSWQIQKI